MIPAEHRIHIFTGHYGSGKTEVALNYAMYLQTIGRKVTIVDLDIVNPYFRTKDAEDILASLDIKMLAPTFANTNLDLPSLPPNITSVFFDIERDVVFDVGGDDDGATALGRFHSFFEDEPYNMFLVANPNRPLSASAEEITEMMYAIEATSRLKTTYLVNNANVMQYTTQDTLNKGLEILSKVSRVSDIPIAFSSATEKVAEGLCDFDTDLLKIKLYLKPYWLR